MVPILIVLCPFFHGETGVYQATAIVLASDILGSAVTAHTCARNKNIDLKRGWIMLVCILAMCTIGFGTGFVGTGGGMMMLVRFLTKLPSFIFRKMLHIVAFTCVSLTILTSQKARSGAAS